MVDKFTFWLDLNKPKSSRHYVSGYNTINNILKESNLLELEMWTFQNFDKNFENIASIKKFVDLNSSGNNLLTATLSNYKKFIINNMESTNPPIIPFQKFGWRWATTGISSKLNLPESLFAVLDGILINGNGEYNKTKEFKSIIKKLCINKYEINDQELIKTLTREENQDDGKNIIENSGNYWKHIGLIDPSGQNASVTDLGKSFLKGFVSKDEFVTTLIETYSLPSPVYESSERQQYINSKIKVHPFKIILDIFECFYRENIDSDSIYLSESDLKKIVVPYSIQYKESDSSSLVKLILQFRKDPSFFSNWPNCYSHFGDDKGDRMINEYLFFLEAFDFLYSNTGIETVRSSSKKYFPTQNLIKLFKSASTSSIAVIKNENNNESKSDAFSLGKFIDNCHESGLIFYELTVKRFVASLASKPFVICSGLSGSGKTKLAQAFVQWISENEKQYKIIPVGADWTNREPLLGYPNGLDPKSYVTPESGALQLILEASKEENKNLPFFMILDEMNLSHVERYFADFLSIMESKEKLKLYSNLGEKRYSHYEISGTNIKGEVIPFEIEWPDNLFIIGTVNIDETTYMFSPKVLDRANVIEFRITPEEMANFFNNSSHIDMKALFVENDKSKGGLGQSMGDSFLKLAKDKTNVKIVNQENKEFVLNRFFNELQIVGSEFGFRSAKEIELLITKLETIRSSGKYDKLSENQKIDIAIIQKLLPKIHGSRKKLVGPLEVLAGFCLQRKESLSKDTVQNNTKALYQQFISENGGANSNWNIIYPISFEKIERMLKNVVENGFTSYAEA
ncbi:McrB family protein [Aquirufa antheringensis]